LTSLGASVAADVTVTFGLPKIGQFLHSGREHCGDLWVVDIGIPQRALTLVRHAVSVITPDDLAGTLPARDRDAHKGHFGHLVVLAGARGKTGAGVMAAEAALRAGAGLVTLGIPRSLNLAMEARLTEVMTFPLAETPQQSLSRAALKEIPELIGDTAVALGPGISTHDETLELVRELVRTTVQPMVIDADGLTALAGHLDILKEAAGARILTPHPGEMSRLLETSVQAVQEDRIGSALALMERTGANVVLKGAGSVAVSDDGEVALVPTGNPTMASAGVGDVLTGIIAGLVAQGVSPFDAVCLGTYLHGWVADDWARGRGERGLMATDLLDRIPEALERINRGDISRAWPVKIGGCPFHV
jgi:NAD(P)H-hydrate epimerase